MYFWQILNFRDVTYGSVTKLLRYSFINTNLSKLKYVTNDAKIISSLKLLQVLETINQRVL